MPGLILEGGTFRPIFSCGVMDALLHHDVMFDYVIGVSAGITNGFSYLSRQSERNLELMRRYRNDKRYLSPGNYLKCGSMFGLDFVFDEIPNRLLPFDWDAFNAYEGRIRVGVTNVETGEAEYLDGRELDEKCTMLRATCAIPFYFPPIKIGDKTYYDGGLSDSIPIRKSLADGNDKNLIILTQPQGYRKTLSRSSRAAAAALRHRYPRLAATLLARPKMYNETVCFCDHLAAYRPRDTVLLRPLAPINSFESDVTRLENAYWEGYRLAEARMGEIKRLFD
ncbi:patatin family protein [Butyricicoccus pullicaecorum]|nr:patatin family protein [Butyricicoccus pullicaecorum]